MIYRHSHYYKSCSGPSLPLPNGWHVYDWDFYTTINDGHRHHVSGPNMPAPGIEENRETYHEEIAERCEPR